MKTFKKFAGIMLVALSLTSTILLTNCKKEEKEPEPTPAPAPAPAPAQTNTQKITGKAWKMTAMTVDPGMPSNGTIVTDLFPQVDACDKDDLTTLKADGTFTEDQGSHKCVATDPQVSSGTWVWNSNETIITMTQGGVSSNIEIVSNDGSTLKYKFTETYGGLNYVVTVTAQKQ
jgi:hypothetical protein